NFSIFHAFSTLDEVRVAFAVALLCHLCLLIGYRTRLFAIATFVIVTSMDNRLVMVENGGYVVVNLICGYAMFLPLERRFSVDAWLRSLRERKERSIAELAERHRPAWLTAPHVSVIGVLVLLNLAIVYFFNVVNKSGSIWKHGDTVHYVLWLNRMVTGVAVFFREVLPYPVTRVLTWSVLCVEAVLAPLILAPHGRRITRPVAMVLLAGLHTTFGVMMRLGPFSWYLIGWSLLLLTPVQWEGLASVYRRRAAPRVVVVDRRSALGFHVARVLSRVDHLDLLRFEESPPGEADPPLFRVIDEAAGRASVGVDAAREIAQALPGGRYAFRALELGSFGLAGAALRFAEAHRVGVARALGLGLGARGRAVVDAPSPLRQKTRKVLVVARESWLYWFAFCSVFGAVSDNKSVPLWLKPEKTPAVVHAMLGYPRTFQGWGMFAPNPITEDGTVVVDAITVDGRHVDPFTGKPPELDLTKSDGLGLSQIRQDYFNRIRLDHNNHARQGLHDWILAYPKRTGRAEDEIVAFDAYWVRDECPAPRESRPTKLEHIAIATWRKPGYRPPPPLPPLPPEPRVESAEKKDVPGTNVATGKR
ncbi:MAG TPA: HTTM domain-containing protein, partial [Minicystis sp.]|nr:HTTM domain-containing protein [Minicystis sp.]